MIMRILLCFLLAAAAVPSNFFVVAGASGSGGSGGGSGKPSSSSSSKGKSSLSSTTEVEVSATSSSSPLEDTANAMKDYLKQSGIDPDTLDDMLKGLGGGLGGGGLGGGADGGMPSMAESMEMMQSMMNSPMFQEFMSDPEKLEQSRQMILSNPLLKSMMGSMPGMEDLLNDKDAWVEAMQAAANLYKNLDKDDLLRAMMMQQQQNGGAPGGAGIGGGMEDLFGSGTFGTLDSPSATAALDELDEDD